MYISDKYMDLEYDPGNVYSVPYTWGTVGIIYNSKYVDEADVTGWEVMWNEKYADKILMFDNSRDAFGIAQYVLSYEKGATSQTDNYINTTVPSRWDEALAMLREQKPLVQAYVMDEVFNKMESGAAAMAPYYAGDFYTMQEENEDLALVYPKEGTNIFVDAFCIPKGTPDERKLAAERFINFALSTEITVGGEEYNVAKEIAEYICYASPNSLVYESETYIEDMGEEAMEILYPEMESFREAYNTYAYRNLDPDTLGYISSLWEEIKIN